jgi:hypothetical protein
MGYYLFQMIVLIPVRGASSKEYLKHNIKSQWLILWNVGGDIRTVIWPMPSPVNQTRSIGGGGAVQQNDRILIMEI